MNIIYLLISADSSRNYKITFVANYSLHVLYTFDAKFYNEFNGKDGKSGDEHMEEVMALTKAAYLDATLKASLGTAVNIIGTKRRYKKSFTVR